MRLRFKYTNWRGHEHDYLVEPQTLVYQWVEVADSTTVPSEPHWIVNARMISRDGEPRRVGTRSFILANMRDIEEVKG